MRIKMNGKEYLTENDAVTIIELLEERKVTRPETVSVQLNGSFVNRKLYSTTMLKENDEVDFLFMMSGGGF